MTHLPKLMFFALAFALVGSCRKDNGAPAAKEDHASFLSSKVYVFRGALPDSTVLWRYGLFEFQRGHGSIPLGGGERPKRSLSFDLVSNKDLSTRVSISTPSYDVVSGELFAQTLVNGQKEIGSSYNKFELALTLNKKVFTTNGDQAGSVLKVLKTEKSKDEFNRDVVLVWFQVTCKFYSTVDASSFSLKDGYLLAGFMYNL